MNFFEKSILKLILFFTLFNSVSHGAKDTGQALHDFISSCNLALLPKDELQALVNAHVKTELQKTWNQRGGLKRRAIWLLTTSAPKLSETRKIMGRYGIEVLQAPHLVGAMEKPYLWSLLSAKHENVTILSVLREETKLLKRNSGELATLSHGSEADHASTLIVYLVKGNFIEAEYYSHRTPGKIDLSLQKNGIKDVFGWDDVFVIEALGKPYQAMRELELKVSSREMVYSQYLARHVYYQSLKSNNFDPPPIERPIDFNVDPLQLVQASPLFNNAFVAPYGLMNLFRSVINEGLFFRASNNRRQVNYFIPGFNSGLPLTARPNAFHEATYMGHDFGHELIPDLLYSPAKSEHDLILNKRVYIIHRMIGEAVTLILADILFADTLYQAGYAMDGGERPIYHFFKKCGLDFSSKSSRMKSLWLLLSANVELCVTGSDAKFRQLANNNRDALDALEEYKRQFFPFFISDYHWNNENFENLGKHVSEMERWKSIAIPIFQAFGLNRPTIEDVVRELEFSASTPWQTIAEHMFENIFERKIKPVFEAEEVQIDAHNQRLAKAAARYMAGQMAIFAKFDWLQESAAYQKKITDRLLASRTSMTLEDIQAVRIIYEEYLDLLVSKNLISFDDQWTYREVYPIFEPVFVSYREQTSTELSTVARQVLEAKK